MSLLAYKEMSPEDIVKYYYHALSTGDLQSLKFIMTQKSYLMILEVCGWRLSFKDRYFKRILSQAEEDEEILFAVEQTLTKTGYFSKSFPSLAIDEVKDDGFDRKIVQYTEEGISKKLYFSHEATGWKINYYAGQNKDSSPKRF